MEAVLIVLKDKLTNVQDRLKGTLSDIQNYKESLEKCEHRKNNLEKEQKDLLTALDMLSSPKKGKKKVD